MDRDNPAVDDNLAVMLDYDSDGDPDVLVASLAVTAPPIIGMVEQIDPTHLPIVVRARVHDNKSPTAPHDWQSVVLRWTHGGKTREIPMQWYGEYLWRATPGKAKTADVRYQVCAIDAVGNKACSLEINVGDGSN